MERDAPRPVARRRICAIGSCLVLLLLCTCLDSKVFSQLTTAGAISGNYRVHKEQAEAWFLRGRAMPGESAARLRHQAHIQKMQMRAAGATEAAISTALQLRLDFARTCASGLRCERYRPAGLQLVSGRATAVAVDPADATANTVYVGGAYGGVWKSTNAAAANPASVTWTPLIDSQATLVVGAIAIQPQLSNPNPANSVILVGTGEANSSADSYYGLGILWSANAGSTWRLISADSTGTHPFAGIAFSKIAFSTSNSNLAVAAAAGASEGILEGSQCRKCESRPLLLTKCRHLVDVCQRGRWHTGHGRRFGNHGGLQRSRRSILRGVALSRILFLIGRNQLDTARESAWAWAHHGGVPGAIEQHNLSHLPGRNCCRARA